MSGNSTADGVNADWSAFSVSTIWEMVKDETREYGYAQVDVWQRISDLCTRHADTVEKAVAQLKNSWPAKPDNAADLFQRELSILVRSLRDTAKVATNNARELQGITEHIIDVKQRIAPLAQERQPVSSTPMPQGGTVRENQLNSEAQQVMRAKEPVAAASAQRLQSPRVYDPRLKDAEDQPPDEADPRPPGAGGDMRLMPLDGPSDPLRPSWSVETPEPVALGQTGPQLAGETAAGAPATPGAGSGGGGSGTTPPTGGSYGSPALPGQVIGPIPARPAAGTAAPYGYTGSPGQAGRAGGLGSGAQGHGAGGLLGGAPMAIGGGRPAVTSGGVRVGRPGEVIGGGNRRRPHDPDDPWAVDRETVEPVIGGPPAADDNGDDGLPPGVVEIRGWPR